MSFWQDAGQAARLLRKSPSFTLTAALVLALGIGATTAIFSLVDATLLQPLPFRDPQQLVMLWQRSDRSEKSLVSTLDFLDWKEQNATFSAMAAAVRPIQIPLSDETGRPESVALQSVTAGFFELLAVTPTVGRTFVAEDDVTSGDVSVGVVISERLWTTAFDADPGVVGRALRLGSPPRPVTVLGVVSSRLQLFGNVDVWEHLPINRRDAARGQGVLQVIGRLRADASIARARADMAIVARNIERIAPATNTGWTALVQPLKEAIVGDDLRRTSLVLGGVVLFVLLLACANVANLVLARGVARRREIAVRAALGGTPMRISIQLLTESALLGLLGGIAGVAMAWVILRVAPAAIPPQTLPASIALAIDWRVLAFALLMTVLTALLVGVAPAWQAVRVPLIEAINAGARGSSDRSGRLRPTLVVVEIASALLLLIGSGLFVRTLVSLDRVDPGYHADNVVTMSIQLPFRRLVAARPGELGRYWHAIEDEIASISQVRLVALGSNVPLNGTSPAQAMPFEIIGGESAADPASRPRAQYQVITPRYFATLGIALTRGRVFTNRDSYDATPVAIVNEEFVRRHLAGRDPIRAHVTIQNPLTFRSPPVTREIVGVVAQVKTRPDEPSDNALQIYVPLAQNNWLSPVIVVQTSGDPTRVVPDIKAAVARVDPTQAVARVRTMAAVTAEATARPRFRAQLVTTLAAAATVLAAVGVFSLLSFMVQQRARELSVRLAIGAGPRDLLALVLGDGLRLVAVGVVLGIVASALLDRSLESLLFGVTPMDPVTFLTAPAVLTLVAILACITPAIRALRADPVAALRSE